MAVTPTNPIVLTTFADPDPNASPITVGDLVNLLKQLVSSSIQGSYMPYIIQHETPNPDQQDFVWIETDTAGRPIATKIWYGGLQGAWRRVYNGMIGEIRGYSGDPSVDFEVSSDPEQHGAYTFGKIGEQYDGWHICNGLDGTPNLSDKFLLGAHMDNSATHTGYSSGWQSSILWPDGSIRDQKTGGAFIETVKEENLPLLSNAISGDDPGLWIYGHGWKDDTAHPSKVPIVDVNFANQHPYQVNLLESAFHIGNPPTPGAYGKNPPTPMFTVDPFIVVGWIIFKGYS